MEKELDLIRILRDCPNGEPLFSRAFGNVTLRNVDISDEIIEVDKHDKYGLKVVEYKRDGRLYHDGLVDLYPSEELARKYPHAPAKAWDRFAKSMEPKWWCLKDDEQYWYVTDSLETNGLHHFNEDKREHVLRKIRGNCFKSEEEARSTAEVLKEVFRSLHAPQLITEAYVVRFEDNSLTLFGSQPKLVALEEGGNMWMSNGGGVIYLNEKALPFVTVENSPLKVQLTFRPVL